MFEVEYLQNSWVKKEKVDANLINYNPSNFNIRIDLAFQSWGPRGHILKSLALASKVNPWPWLRGLKSSKIGQSWARGQHYF